MTRPSTLERSKNRNGSFQAVGAVVLILPRNAQAAPMAGQCLRRVTRGD